MARAMKPFTFIAADEVFFLREIMYLVIYTGWHSRTLRMIENNNQKCLALIYKVTLIIPYRTMLSFLFKIGVTRCRRTC